MNIQFSREQINAMRESYGCGLDEAKRRLMNEHLKEKLEQAKTVDQLKAIMFYLIDRGFYAP